MFGKIAVSVVSILLVVGVVIGVVVVTRRNDSSDEGQLSQSSMKMITSICELTNYKEACTGSLESTAKNTSATALDYILAVVGAPLDEVKKSIEVAGKISVNKEKDQSNYIAVEDCKDLLDYAIDTLQASISLVGDSEMHTLEDRAHELLSWMTSVYALQTSCLDQIASPEYKSAIENGMINATQLTHNAVNIVAEVSQVLKFLDNDVQMNTKAAAPRRRLMSTKDGYPIWFKAAERRLLSDEIKPNVVVAKDGSGQFKTINAAIAAYPANYNGRFIIHVKEGIYDEQVIIDKNKPNIFIYGDGIGKTIVTERINDRIMNAGTMHTATFANEAAGFIARGITFRNEAGPEGHQAVAFRSMGDKAALFDCSFEGFQDTLFYQVFRQFYKNCRIYGTIDFIFGKGDAVIQDSEIIVRKPLPNQWNTVTADGREIRHGSNGLVLQNCRIVPDKELYPVRFQVQTYLGRPWTHEALTVVMQSELGDFIRPEGWKLWDKKENHKTCEMFEFANRGPGARTDGRSKEFVRFRVLNPTEAAQYTPGRFLAGDQWLPQTGLPSKLGF